MLTPLIKSTQVLAYGVALATLAACTTVGPDFAAPAAPAATAYRHVAGKAEAARLPQQWWTVFGDASLNALEARALQDNPSLKASAQRMLQAQAQFSAARAGQGASVNVGAGVSNTRSSSNTSQGLALGHRSIEGNNYSVGGSLSYELDVWGKMRRVVEAADAQVMMAQDERDSVYLLLSAQIASTYWQLRGIDAERTILQDALSSRLDSEEIIQARFDGGLSNELDLSRARIERANAQADLHELQRQRNTLEHSLATLVGSAPSTPLLTAWTTALPAAPVIPVGLPASLLGQRPDLAASVAALRSSNAQVGVAESAFYPSLSLTGNFGYASEALRELSNSGSRQFSLGPLQLSLPLFDGGRNKSGLALAKARYQEALANHEGKLLTALREVEDALSDVEQRARQSDAQAQARTAATRAHEVARARYDRGLSNYLDVTDAQRSALTAQRAAAQIDTQRLLAAVSLARALGGGWGAAAASPASAGQ